MVTSMLDSIGGPPELASAGVMLLFGLAIGLPDVATGRDARLDGRSRRRREEEEAQRPSRHQRRSPGLRGRPSSPTNKDLGDPNRDVKVSIAGDGGTVLKLEGKINAKEAERLTADMKDVGFKRVEGGGSKSWWVRV